MRDLTTMNRRDWFLWRLQEAINDGDGFQLSKILRSGKGVATGEVGASKLPQPIAFVALTDEELRPAAEDRRRGTSLCHFVVIISFEVQPDFDSEGLLDAEANRIICELLEPRMRALVGNSHQFAIEKSRTETVVILSTYATYSPTFVDDDNKGTVMVKGTIDFNRHIG